VGRAGHWVEIEVCGECSDDDLALIVRLARETDCRSIVVVRKTADGSPRFRSCVAQGFFDSSTAAIDSRQQNGKKYQSGSCRIARGARTSLARRV
jgi:hypothetical protein